MKKYKNIIQFIIISFACYLAWFIVYEWWLGPSGKLDFWLTGRVTSQSVQGLKLLGFEVFHTTRFEKHFVTSLTGHILGVSAACNGLVLYPLFAGFILATPGLWKRKALMILAGSIAIYILNLVRVMGLCIIQLRSPQYLDFNHKYTFVLLVYGFIFFLWMIWINKFSEIKSIQR